MPKFQIQLQGEWKDFDAAESKFLEDGFNSGKAEVRFETRGQNYDVDFRAMQQRNVRTGQKREIRQVFGETATVDIQRPSSPPRRMKFQVNLGGKWQDFDTAESEFLEREMTSGKIEVVFNNRGQTYDVNFKLMTQVNTKTKKEREIRQVVDDNPATPAKPSPPVVAARPVGPGVAANPAQALFPAPAPPTVPGHAVGAPIYAAAAPAYPAAQHVLQPVAPLYAGYDGGFGGFGGHHHHHHSGFGHHRHHSGGYGGGAIAAAGIGGLAAGMMLEAAIDRPHFGGGFGGFGGREEIIIREGGFFGGREEVIIEDFGPFGGREEIIIRDDGFW